MSAISSSIPSVSYASIPGDPLLIEQKDRIKRYVESYLLSDREEIVTNFTGNRVVRASIFNRTGSSYHYNSALAKTYDSFSPAYLQQAKEILDAYHLSKADGKTFATFRKVLKDPKVAAAEFGIDPARDDQVFAAQKFMKVVIANLHLHKSFNDLLAIYRDKLASVKRGEAAVAISVKNKLLMQNDPVEKLSHSDIPSPLALILAHTFFLTPKTVQTTRTRQANGASCEVRQEYGPTREEARRMIKREILKLWQSPETRHVLTALAALITIEKGNIFLGEQSIGDLGKPYGVRTGPMGSTAGFYAQNRHTIIMSSLINPFTGTVISSRAGTLIHETLHFLFTKIVKNGASPTNEGSAEEGILDQALLNDRNFRSTINPNSLNASQRSVWNSLVDDLEQQSTYFPRGFNASNPEHKKTMRIEAIVRIMEQVAEGISLSEIRAIAPHLCEFYYQYSKPKIEAFTANPTLFIPGLPTAIASPIPVTPELLPPSRTSSPVAADPIPAPSVDVNTSPQRDVSPQPTTQAPAPRNAPLRPQKLSFVQRVIRALSWLFSKEFFHWLSNVFS